MALNVISNFAANVAHRNLTMSDAAASSSLTKLSSGQRVVSAKDDAASLAVGSRLRAEVVAMKTASVNAGQAGSMLQIADGAMATISDILIRMKDLAVQASSGQFSNTERSILDSEFQALLSEITRISDDTEFNGTQLIAGVAEAAAAFNTDIGTDLTGITKVDFGTNGSTGDVASFSYVSGTTTLTVTIGSETGVFDLSAQAAGTYTSTGTLAGIEVTLDGTFTFGSSFSNVDSTAVVGNSNLFQLSTEGVVLDAADSNLDKADVSFNFKGSAATFLTTEYITIDFVDSSDQMTVKYYAANGSLTDTATVIDLTSSLDGGTQTFTLAGGGDLTGATITLNVDLLDGGDTTTTVASASSDNLGKLRLNATPLIDASTVFNGTEISNFTVSEIVFTVDNAGLITGTATSGYVAATADNFTDATPTVTITHTSSGQIFTVEFTVDTVSDTTGGDSVITLNLNELLNAFSIDAKSDLTLDNTDPAISITSSTFDADDLAALTQATMTLSVTGAGVVSVKAGTGPTGWTVDSAQSETLAATGLRNVVLTDGTNSFTVQIDVDTAISTGGGAEIVVDLKELQDTVGLGTQLGKTSFTYKVGTGNKSYDNLTFQVTAASGAALSLDTNLITTAANAELASTAVSAAIDTLNQSRSDIGAAQNRLTFAAQNLASAIENAEAARSNLLDLDVAAEMTNFTSKQVLLQTGIAMLAQANQLPQNLLRLFQ